MLQQWVNKGLEPVQRYFKIMVCCKQEGRNRTQHQVEIHTLMLKKEKSLKRVIAENFELKQKIDELLNTLLEKEKSLKRVIAENFELKQKIEELQNTLLEMKFG